MLLVNCCIWSPELLPVRSFLFKPNPNAFPQRTGDHAAPGIYRHVKRWGVFRRDDKARLDVDPVAGQEVERIINDAFKLDAALLGKLKDIFYK
jgi:hypothetical protein